MKIQKKLYTVLGISISLFIFQIVGGIISNSLALIADSFHVLLDSFAIIISLFAFRIAQKSHTKTLTFGFHRAEIVAAFVNGLSLVGIAAYIVFEAINRLNEPPEIDTLILIVFAIIGMAVNFAMMLMLKSESKTNLNLKGSYLHIMGDLLSSFGVVIGAGIMMFSQIYLVDIIVSIVIAGIITRSGIILCKKCVHIFMEGVPDSIDSKEVEKTIEEMEGVIDVHDLHIWSLTSNLFAATLHVKIRKELLHKSNQIIQSINSLLKEQYGIIHSTIQIEGDDDLVNITSNSNNKS